MPKDRWLVFLRSRPPGEPRKLVALYARNGFESDLALPHRYSGLRVDLFANAAQGQFEEYTILAGWRHGTSAMIRL